MSINNALDAYVNPLVETVRLAVSPAQVVPVRPQLDSCLTCGHGGGHRALSASRLGASVKRDIEPGTEWCGGIGTAPPLIAVDMDMGDGACGQENVGDAVAGKVTGQDQAFFALEIIGGVHVQDRQDLTGSVV